METSLCPTAPPTAHGHAQEHIMHLGYFFCNLPICHSLSIRRSAAESATQPDERLNLA